MFTNLNWIWINMRNKSKSSIYNRLSMARLLILSKIADFCTTKIFFSLLFFASNYDSSRIRTKSNGWFHEWKYTQICSVHERETEKETPYQAVFVCAVYVSYWDISHGFRCIGMFMCYSVENIQLTQAHLTRTNVKWWHFTCNRFSRGKNFSFRFIVLCTYNAAIQTRDGTVRPPFWIFEISCSVT